MRGLLLAGALGLPLSVLAHPTHQSHTLQRRIVDLNNFRLHSVAKYIDSTKSTGDAPSSFSGFAAQSYVDTATQLVKNILPDATFRVIDDHYVGSNGVAHVNFRQTAHGLDIDNADFNVNVGKDGKVFSYGHSFYTGKIPEASPLTKRDFADPVAALRGTSEALQLSITLDQVSAEAAEEKESFHFRGVSGTVSDPKAQLVYFAKPDGELALTWKVETDIDSNWLLTYIDAASTKDVHGVVDYVSEADYQVFAWGINDPTEGDRTVISDPWDPTASAFTWISDGENNYTTTRGNNGIAQDNPTGGSSYLKNYRPDSPELVFKYPYTSEMSPPKSYRDASIVQLFYTANTYHDLLYTLGFDEKAGNFQWNNNGKGGRGQDYVILNAQDGSGTNNANFATPPDGQPGRMRMYTWTTSTPNRDGSFEAGIVIHEYTHGVSNRLTGGPANSRCLNALESGGMGEGWGDFMATAIRLKSGDTHSTDYTMGEWAANKKGGIRAYPYSTSLSTNPYTYTSVNSLNAVHAIGTVWATMLYEVLWALIDKHGKNDGPRPEFKDGVPTDGKYLTMKLVIDGMALQPCNPNFIQARDAILDADKALTGGDNQCQLWRAFAKRGLGEKAEYHATGRVDSKDIPSGVC
ncbi:Fungalysin/Thermolysin Extracellular metalloproteinase 5 [Aspergillus alliaceus]|uniref:Extracellular metalloproteinase n=1 Tax=Petromyces alliaceus TaxID=209559 RepID=A0A5N7CFK3_PETAA|nr:extracellular metallo proteinase NpI [Aspergillus alliaceus]KAB8230273.1 extracellular metallo proteinase NpI [Aspergillus alliaceus]KAE8392548.1 extracellular metallo proteinase NpI [Aspergillus alliaceus]KAF5864602.1 Fungalysin/Thermolysin Extracellular metalloproteinase 5 [Aspergillus burnettii]